MAFQLGERPNKSDVGKRDATHIAQVVMSARTRLWPGQRVQRIGVFAEPWSEGIPLGIVDPWMDGYAEPDTTVLILVKPDDLDGPMRHTWSSKALPVVNEIDPDDGSVIYDDGCGPDC